MMNNTDVGSGSGYLLPLFHRLVSPGGKVIGIEHVPELVEASKRALSIHHGDALESGEIEVHAGDGRKGCPKEAPFDAIHVGAASPSMPEELIKQLKSPGRMFVPIGERSQSIFQIDKDKNGKVSKKELYGYVSPEALMVSFSLS
jgi:protein-L-isoaspartate(D-aspartate) O-methyltransferase